MKILRQSAIIAAVCAVAELIKYLLPLPIPASVYGLILMLLALLTGLIKPEQISTVADFFISIMPVLFIAPTVALITQPEHLHPSAPQRGSAHLDFPSVPGGQPQQGTVA